jgi:hypothetical protein
MPTPPTFSAGQILTSGAMNDVGLWLIQTQTVPASPASSSIVVDPVFSADYDNYRIIYSGFTASANASLAMQLNNSTGTTYQLSGIFLSFGSTTVNGYGPAAMVRWTDVSPASTNLGYMCMDLFGPFLSVATRCRTTGNSASGYYDFGGSDTSTNSSTGFTLTHSAGGTLSGGTIRVYGYRN